MRHKLFFGSLILLLAVGLTSAGTENRWLHIRVVEDNGNGENVSVNIPLSLVEAILPTIESNELHKGRVTLPASEIEGVDLREILEAIRDAPDANFVTVKDGDESVVVAKEQGFLVVRVDEDSERVRVRMPLDVVDAMLSGGGDEIDLLAGLMALSEYDSGDLVTVESDDTSVRIWIDSTDSGE